jgi:hypothetical protein
MKESPAYQEIMNEGGVLTRRADILANLEERIGTEVAEQVRADVQTIEDLTRLMRLHRLSVRCPDLAGFREGLRAEMPARRRAGQTSRRRR